MVRHKPDSHRESVDVFIQLIQETDALNDHVVHSVDIELDLAAGIAVTQTQLCFAGRLLGEAFHQLVEVQPNSCKCEKPRRVSKQVSGQDYFALKHLPM